MLHEDAISGEQGSIAGLPPVVPGVSVGIKATNRCKNNSHIRLPELFQYNITRIHEET